MGLYWETNELVLQYESQTCRFSLWLCLVRSSEISNSVVISWGTLKYLYLNTWIWFCLSTEPLVWLISKSACSVFIWAAINLYDYSAIFWQTWLTLLNQLSASIRRRSEQNTVDLFDCWFSRSLNILKRNCVNKLHIRKSCNIENINKTICKTYCLYVFVIIAGEIWKEFVLK